MGHCRTDTEESRLQDGVDTNDAIAAKKIQKSDREKLRREQINEQFQQLGNVLDSYRHKNDKATIVINAIQALKDLTSEVSRLQSEHAALCQESNELTKENKELKEENTYLQSDFETFGAQYNQTLSFMFPWAPIDPSVVIAPPFSYPVALPLTPGPFPMCSPPLQPIPFFGNQSGVSSHPCSMFIPCLTSATPHMERASTLNASSSYTSSKEDLDNVSSGPNRNSNSENIGVSEDIVTDLELKLPGSTSPKLLPEDKGKQPLMD